jgi:DNA-binding NtrC family response regulator
LTLELPAPPNGPASGTYLYSDAVLSLDEMIRRYILEVLEKNGGNKSQAARVLGITRKTLRERLERS